MRLAHARTLALSVLLIASLIGCDSDGANEEFIDGTFSLRSWSGIDPNFGNFTALAGEPVTYEDQGVSVTTTTDATITLTPSKTFSFSSTTSVEVAGLGQHYEDVMTWSATGTYEVDGSTVTLSGVDDDGEVLHISGRLDGDLLTLTAEGVAMVFER